MKIKHLLLAAAAAVLTFAACQEKVEDLGEPNIDLSTATLEFGQGANSQTITLNSTRDWKATDVADWAVVEPASGKASKKDQTVTIAVLENTDVNRTCTIKFTCGIDSEYLTVNQAGPNGGPVEGEGTKASPYSASQANRLGAELGAEEQLADVFVSGKISTIKSVDTSFGNAEYYISDDGSANDEFYIYRGYSLGGNKFKTQDEIKVGDEVVVYGTIINFKSNTVEMTTGSRIVVLNGQEYEGGDDGGDDVDPITGTDLLTNGSFEDWTDTKPAGWNFSKGNATLTKSSDAKEGSNACEVSGSADSNLRLMSKEYVLLPGTYQIQAYIKGAGQYRVGYTVLENGAPKDSDSYIYVDEAPVQATSDWTLHTVQFKLEAQTSVSVTIMNSKKGAGKTILVDDVKLVTNDGGLGEGGSDSGDDGEGGGDDTGVVETTVAQLLANPKTDVTYRLSGTVSGFNSKYCSFDITDASGSIYVYSVTTETKAEYSEKLANGDTVTIEGKYSYYAAKSQHEIVDAKITAWTKGGDDGGQGGGDVDPSTLTQITCAAFNALSTSDTDYYILEGNVTTIENTQYGNLYIKDDSGEEAYIYGLNGKNGEAFGELGVAKGDKIKIYGQHTVYNGTTVEMKGAKLLNITKGDDGGSADAIVVLSFPDDNSANNKVNGYDEPWTAKSGSYSFTMAAFNNYEWKGWTYIRCGRKAASVASIATNEAIGEAVSKVVIAIDKITAADVNSISLIVAKDAAFSDVVETVAVNAAKGDVEASISTPAEGLYYKLVFDCKESSEKKNGFVQVSALSFMK